MLIEDIEESNEAGVINERLEGNISKHVDIVSAFGDSNIVSNRESPQEPKLKHNLQDQVFFSYGGAESPDSPTKIEVRQQESYASQAANNNQASDEIEVA